MELLILSLLVIKHFLADFPLQTQEMISNKGKYGNFTGAGHSVIHGLFTCMVFIYATPYFLLFGLVDFLFHYHIDWIKMRFGCQDISNKKFWVHLGLDQLAHYLTYIGLVYAYVIYF